VNALRLTPREAPRYPLDLSGLRPDALAERSENEIAALPLWYGNERHTLGELFEVRGDPSDGTLVISDACASLCAVGADMTGGRLIVEGHAGDYLGRRLRGGEIRVEGSCGDFACAAMRGGHVEIRGNTGDFLGGALAGERVGMRGGTVIVRGHCGDRAGERQRRGLLLLEGDAGDYCACNMIAGTLAVLGRTGKAAGFGMRRGTLLLGSEPQAIPNTFVDNGPQTLAFLALLAGRLSHLDGPFGRLAERGNRVRRWLGDRACGGCGEVLTWKR